MLCSVAYTINIFLEPQIIHFKCYDNGQQYFEKLLRYNILGTAYNG